jgi:hypothetical protein
MPGLAIQLPPPGPGQLIAAAAPGGGAANAVQIVAPFVKIAAVATAADSVKLPMTYGGDQIFIQNQGAAAVTVWGFGGATINGAASISQGAGLGALYIASMEGTWARFLQG